MDKNLSAAEMRGLAMLCGENEGMKAVISAVAARQPGSIAMHQRGLASLSGIHAQLPYAAPLLPLCVARAEGSRIIDVDGHEYIDCHMAYTASILGHGPRTVTQAVQEAMRRGIGAGAFFEEQVELAELVREMVPGLERVALFHSGGEAVAASIRLARAATRRMRVARFEGCYHGWHDVGVYNTMMTLSGRLPSGPLDDIPPQAATGGVSAAAGSELLILPYNSPVAFELIQQHANELACVLVDPVPPFLASWPEEARAFIAELRAVTSRAGVPLIFDEVVSGFRLSRGGAQEAFDVQADLACYGKISSGLGIPLAMVGGKARFLDGARTDGAFADYRAGKAWVSSTHSGSFLAVVSALAQLRYLSEHHDELMARLDRNHARLDARLREFARSSGIPVSLQGHPRLQSVLSIGHAVPTEKTYRAIMGSASPWAYRSLLAMTFYLRLHGVHTKTVPTMNLSAAHTEEDVELIAEAIEKSLLRMKQDGMLPS